MKKKTRKNFCTAICMLIAFVIWTAAICFVDVQAIGPQESSVGFARINRFVHNLTGVHMFLYNITDWLGLVPLIFVIGFALIGLIPVCVVHIVKKVREKNSRDKDFSASNQSSNQSNAFGGGLDNDTFN